MLWTGIAINPKNLKVFVPRSVCLQKEQELLYHCMDTRLHKSSTGKVACRFYDQKRLCTNETRARCLGPCVRSCVTRDKVQSVDTVLSKIAKKRIVVGAPRAAYMMVRDVVTLE
jgi:hypothetical protein